MPRPFAYQRSSLSGCAVLAVAAGGVFLVVCLGPVLGFTSVEKAEDRWTTLLGGSVCAGTFYLFGLILWWLASGRPGLAHDDEAILFLRGHRVVGQLPFANVESIATHTYVETPANSLLQRALWALTQQWTDLLFSLFKSNKPKETAGGVLFEVHDLEDRDTEFPSFCKIAGRREVILSGDWTQPFDKIAETLAAAHELYQESLGDEGRDRFDFS